MYHLEPGTVIADNFQVITKIGEGGMGAVYLGVDLAEKKQVALKTITRDATNKVALGRFRRETQALVKLTHQNIARVHSWGMHEQKVPYLVMELFNGISLAEYLKAKGPLDTRETIVIFRDILAAIHYAHFMGVIHRDIKPSNIILSLDKMNKPRSAKLVDFGLARFEDSDGQSLTKTGDIIGSPTYMSPEQWNGAKLDQRSDIYSLGCTIYEALQGTPPYHGESPFALFIMHDKAEVPKLSDSSRQSNEYRLWDKLIASMMAKDPNRRYQNAYELKADFERLERGLEPFGFVQKPIKEKDVSNFPIKSASATLMGLLIVSLLAIGWLLRERPASYPVIPQSQSQSIEAVPATPNPGFNPSPINVTRLKNSAIWHFPRNQVVGNIGVYGSGKSFPTYGDVTLPNLPLTLTANEELVKQPNIIRAVDRGDIFGLQFEGRVTDITDEQLTAFTPFRNLSSLDLIATSITGNSIDTINKFPNLCCLKVNSSEIKGSDLTRLKNLNKLKFLGACNLEEIKPLLPYIARARQLTKLHLRGDGLIDDDLSYIGQCKTLHDLSLGKNSKLTHVGLAKLTSLKQLDTLDLERVPLNKASVEVLRQFKKLKLLVTSPEMATPEVFNALKKALPPKCTIKRVRDFAKELSMGDSRIFHIVC
jgi:serine/threonine protein kinase